MTNIKERILYIADFQKEKKEDFFKNLGFSYANFKGIQKKSALGSDAIDKILTKYPDVDANWLLTGKGEMLKGGDVPTYIAKHVENKGIPLLPIKAFAGIGGDFESFDISKIEERYDIPLFKNIKVDFMIPVTGSSMYPKYSSGDVVACRFISELLFIQWNKVYVLDTASQGVIMKRLKKAEKENNITCKSDNTTYDEFDIPVSDIRSIALVVGVIRLE